MEPFKFRRPTNPGQVPLQFATVRIGPCWVNSPCNRWLYVTQTDYMT